MRRTFLAALIVVALTATPASAATSKACKSALTQADQIMVLYERGVTGASNAALLHRLEVYDRSAKACRAGK